MRGDRWRRVAITCLAAAVASSSAVQAAAYPWLSLDQRLERAVDLFVGVVVRVTNERRGDDPWTLVTLNVEHWFVHDGALVERGPDDVTLAFLGGEATGAGARSVAGLPTFTVGERYLVASYGAESRAASPLVGVTQGLWIESDGSWRDPAGAALGVDDGGTLVLDDDGAPFERWREALEVRLGSLRGAP